jgi:hypothetical protein
LGCSHESPRAAEPAPSGKGSCLRRRGLPRRPCVAARFPKRLRPEKSVAYSAEKRRYRDCAAPHGISEAGHRRAGFVPDAGEPILLAQGRHSGADQRIGRRCSGGISADRSHSGVVRGLAPAPSPQSPGRACAAVQRQAEGQPAGACRGSRCRHGDAEPATVCGRGHPAAGGIPVLPWVPSGPVLRTPEWTFEKTELRFFAPATDGDGQAGGTAG